MISLDFSKAFDTVQYSTQLEKMAKLDIPANAYNWLVHFVGDHTHSTVYNGERSKMKFITADIIQGLAIGPASYVATSRDLNAVIPENRLVKFADDACLVIPASNDDSRTVEIRNVETWACQNNLTLNSAKTKEIVVLFVDRHQRHQMQQPPLLSDIARVSSMKILGIT